MHDSVTGQPPAAKRGSLTGLIALLRPKQWIKNGFVLAPLIFTGNFLSPAPLLQALLATVAFCLAASAAYIVNDLHDIERDRRHPHKAKHRPLASGQVSKRSALLLLGLLYVLLIASHWVIPAVSPVIAGYLLLNIAYTFGLKNQPVLDIFTIALGFVLRVHAGATALAVPVSDWMFITTLCLALYLASIKRRQEMLGSGDEGRPVLRRYSVALIERYAEISAAGALIFYSMFVMSARQPLVLTIPLVLFGLFRYWYVVEEMDAGESPSDALLADWPLLTTVALWIATCGWVIARH